MLYATFYVNVLKNFPFCFCICDRLIGSLNICEIKFRKVRNFILKNHILINFHLTFELRLSRKTGTFLKDLVLCSVDGFFFFFLQWNLSKGIKDFSHTHESGVALLCPVLLSYIFFFFSFGAFTGRNSEQVKV